MSTATLSAKSPGAELSASGERRAVVEAKGLVKRYGNYAAVNGLDLTLYEGEIFGLLGPNGAGKTTTVLMLLGLTEPTAGEVRVLGKIPTREPLDVKSQVGYLPENIGFYDDMTGFENLMYTASLNGIPRDVAAARIDELLEAVGLQEARDKRVRVYSRGMRQRLGLADVLVKQPKLIILDEPTLGIDPAGTREILQLIARLAEEKQVSVMLSSHLLHQVQQICHRVGILVGGRLVAQGTLEQLTRELSGSVPAVVEVEIGAEADGAVNLLRSLDGVVDVVTETSRKLAVHCRDDLRAAVAQTLVSNGIPLLSLQLRTFALDDIYHLYFKGGDEQRGSDAGRSGTRRRR